MDARRHRPLTIRELRQEVTDRHLLAALIRLRVASAIRRRHTRTYVRTRWWR